MVPLGGGSRTDCMPVRACAGTAAGALASIALAPPRALGVMPSVYESVVVVLSAYVGGNAAWCDIPAQAAVRRARHIQAT